MHCIVTNHGKEDFGFPDSGHRRTTLSQELQTDIQVVVGGAGALT
jgi:hypothetical protein